MKTKNIYKAFFMMFLITLLVDAYWIFIEYWWHYFFGIGFVLIAWVCISWAEEKEVWKMEILVFIPIIVILLFFVFSIRYYFDYLRKEKQGGVKNV